MLGGKGKVWHVVCHEGVSGSAGWRPARRCSGSTDEASPHLGSKN